jgi:splicing factor 3B subunit 1
LQLIDTTVELANKVGVTDIIGRVVDDLKDESEPYRKMVMETVEKIVANLGTADIDQRLEERMMDGMLFAFQEQTTDDSVMLNGRVVFVRRYISFFLLY